MIPFLAPVLATTLAAFSPPQATPHALFEEFKTICLDWDGDPVAAEEVALEHGYEPAQDLIPDDLFQGYALRVWYQTRQDVEWRVLIQVDQRMRGFGGGATHHNRCFVSARQGGRRDARAAVQAHLGFRPFRQRDTDVFTWISNPDGEKRSVGRGAFEHRGPVTLTERGMRMILVREHRGQVMLTYMAPSRADPAGLQGVATPQPAP